MRASKRLVWLLVSMLAAGFGADVSAHRLDEFLQAARIAIARDRVQVEMDLTPGVAVADDIIRAIDADGDGALTGPEQQAYADRVVKALTVRIDDAAPLPMQPAAASVPEAAALRTGDSVIVIRSAADLSHLPAGVHHLSFENRHTPAQSVYLANALVPDSDQVVVTGQQRDDSQRELNIEFVLSETPTGGSARWLWLGLLGAVALAVPLTRMRRPTRP